MANRARVLCSLVLVATAIGLPGAGITAPASAPALAAPSAGAGGAALVDFRPPPTHAAGRSHLDLSGQWQYIVDPMQVGLRKRGRMRSFFRDLEPTGNELIEYEWRTAPTLAIPGDWNSRVPELAWYEGTVWFRRAFEVTPVAGRRYFVHFEAANRHAHVYLNGTRLGEHVGGFTPFAFEATDALRPGSNVLVVAVDNRHDDASVPATQFDWWNYGGITRPVRLVDVPATYVHDYAVRLERDGRIVAEVDLEGEAAAGREVRLEIPGLGVAVTARADDAGRVRLAARPRGLVRWSPERPQLYEVRVAAGDDAVVDRVGFRTIEVDGPRLLLNGRPVFLRGISLHEEAIGHVATRTLTWASARALLEEARALGANFVRLAHYPHSEKMARLADELGLLVWAEIPVYWEMDFANPTTLAQARAMLGGLIARDVNRASVVIWSVANETPETPERLRFLGTLIDDARRRDPSRLVSAALHDDADASSGPDGVVSVDDPLGELVDVVAFNRYEAWYGIRTPSQIDEVTWRTAFDKPLIFSEFGADALYGARGDRGQRWTEDYQQHLYEETLEMAERIPNLAGVSPWILKDFRSPRRFHSRWQEYWNRKGVIDPAGNRKLAWTTLRDWYARKAREERAR